MYQVLLKLKDGRVSYLEHRNRRAWTLTTARKHIKDVIARAISDPSYSVQYATLVKE